MSLRRNIQGSCGAKIEQPGIYRLKYFFDLFLFLLLSCLPMSAQDMVPVPLKNLLYVEGMRSNLLVGYGLVVGLSGTGDSLRSSPFTRESVIAMLNRLGVNTRMGAPGKASTNMSTRNTAAVMVTAKLPPFARQGMPIDVSVAALGDARSLHGGMLLVTPLMGADGEVYAVGQGTLASTSFQAQGASFQGRESGTSVVRGVPTAASITGGAIVEKEIPFSFGKKGSLRFALQDPNFTTARRIADVIQDNFPFLKAKAIDPGTIDLVIPPQIKPKLTTLMSEIESLYVVPDIEGRVVIDERDGVIVIGSDVRVSPVAISQGNLTINIQESFDVSQPTGLVGATSAWGGGSTGNVGPGGSGGILGSGGNAGTNIAGGATAQSPFGGVETVTTQNVDINVQQEGSRKIGMIRGTSLKEVVDGLNAFNLSIQDLSAVLRAIKSAGALHAKLEIR